MLERRKTNCHRVDNILGWEKGECDGAELFWGWRGKEEREKNAVQRREGKGEERSEENRECFIGILFEFSMALYILLCFVCVFFSNFFLLDLCFGFLSIFFLLVCFYFGLV